MADDPATKYIAEQVNRMELRRTILRGEANNPPADCGPDYIRERLDKARALDWMIDALKPLLKP